jgi:hypothetical protein
VKGSDVGLMLGNDPLYKHLLVLVAFMGMFSLGYFPILVLGRIIMRQRICGNADAFAPLAALAGIILAHVIFGPLGLDRFFLVSHHVRTAWQSLGWFYELGEAVFDGVVCALILVSFEKRARRSAETLNIVTLVTAALVSFLASCVWPVLCSRFV